MAKGQERKKEEKRKPKLSMMEKRALKRAKREGKTVHDIMPRPGSGGGQS
jgi:hypothetical protein